MDKVKMLKNLQVDHRVIWDSAYPGCGEMYVATINPSDGYAIVTSMMFHMKYQIISIDELIRNLYLLAASSGISAARCNDGNWVQDREYEHYSKILEYTSDEYYINAVVWNLVNAIKSYIWNNRDNPGTIGQVIYSSEDDIVDMNDFASNEEVIKFMLDHNSDQCMSFDQEEDAAWDELSSKVHKSKLFK